MWGQWKDKLMDLFYTEVEEEEVDTQKRSNHRMQNKDKLETKVMYQYPENKAFRFPVIPDRGEQSKPMDTPAYQRRSSDDYKREQRIQKKSKPTNEQRHEPTRERKKQVKQDRGPFQPTQVASPIHGYQQQKKDQEVENVPAFIRKQHEEEVKEDSTAEKPVSIEPEVTETVPEKPVAVDDEQAKTEEVIQDKPSQMEKVTKPSEPKKRMKDKKKRNPITNNTKQQGSLPFNVMMSSNDKRKQEIREKLSAVRPVKPVKPVKPAETVKPEQPKPKRSFEVPNYLLNDPISRDNQDQIWVREQQELLEKTLKHFNVRAKVVNATQGPAVTRFEVQPEIGVKVSKVKNLSDDLKLNMAARDIRIEAPIPGKNTIGIEIPNQTSQTVGLQEIFETSAFQGSSSPLTVGLGLNIEGTPMVTNIQKMPHGLIAGATGSGKSVCINTILISLLYKASHEDVKFLLIDPKMVELAPFNEIPHLVSPVITDVKAATIALKWAVNEMEERYEKFVHEGVRDIERFNQKVIKQGRSDEKMPFLVIVIDELADLMMAAPQDVEDSICRIAQKARACGMHLLVATQRPSVDVITGLIKANIPTRIAFSVSSQVDSRTIIDTNGAEKLLGKGDMLFVENGSGKSVRLQGAFVSDDEIERVTRHIRSIAPPDYLFEQEQLLEQVMVDEEDEDDLLSDAIKFVMKQNGASTSLLQRHFKIGYNRAARLMDTMEMRGIISEQNGSKPREILLSTQQLEAME
ncbi:DNA translocase FtsK [Virgibacillus necropolis]|uniref:DNA translocase FtsK n=1 Tax=Virgibacillus necropolis TaxID=163877 RepID=A0A221MBH0_9BACI|nr:DNA translocase FtsK [Virgibacillus necropolis]ASN04959.1 DNA translocase FtsK [Virgibacillus necropolis]